MEESVGGIRAVMHEVDTVISRVVSKISDEMDELERVLGNIESGLGNLPFQGTSSENQVAMTRSTCGEALSRGREAIRKVKTKILG